MTTTNTLDVEATTNQCIKIYEAGGELVRITTQGRREAEALAQITKNLREKGYAFPLVADIHYNPNAAEIAAQLVEKVRINPGNFAGGAKKIDYGEITEEAFRSGLSDIKGKILPFLSVCKAHNTAIRIGANHGSLSNRMMAKYGDTPQGMVESIMEYLRICCDADFDNIVLSIKSSNTRVMVHTVRLLVATMMKENMNFPLHLGVTEAGSGEDGRIKSAVGIGALLADGLGDTIRVSLTEDPEYEIPVARILKTQFEKRINSPQIPPVNYENYSPYQYIKRESHQIGIVGGSNPALVVPDLRNGYSPTSLVIPEAVIVNTLSEPLPSGWDKTIRIVPVRTAPSNISNAKIWRLCRPQELTESLLHETIVLELTYTDLNEKLIDVLKNNQNTIILLSTSHQNGIAEQRAFFLALQNHGLTHPVIIHRSYKEIDREALQVVSASDTGLLFLDGFGDGLSLQTNNLNLSDLTDLHFSILQAARVRFTRTEFISCPGCGRTLFDLQATTNLVKQKTSHLTGLKIAVMGCIVNGIGEMADADYGYIGSGPGRVSLFKNRELKKKNIPENQAVNELIQLIKENGDWINK